MTAMRMRTAKALVQGMRFSDFSHWKRLPDHDYPTFELEIGRAHRISAVPGEAGKSDTEWCLLYDGDDYILGLCAEEIRYEKGCIVLEAVDGGARIRLPEGFEADAYARRIAGRSAPKGLDLTIDDEDMHLDITCRRRFYWGTSTDADPADLGPILGTVLLDATVMQYFDQLTTFRKLEGNGKRLSLSYDGIDEADYCSQITVNVTGEVDGLLDFWTRGDLSSDGDGAVFRGSDSTLTIILDDKAYADADLRYLETHDVPTWSYAAGKDADRLQAILHPSKEASR